MTNFLEKCFIIDNNEVLGVNWDYVLTIPEFSVLQTCNQSVKYHGEGNAFIHTKCVMEEALKVAKSQFEFEFEDALVFLTAALFHDIGKGVTTELGKGNDWHSYNHEFAGERITRRLLWNEGWEFREAVCSLVRYHMVPFTILKQNNYIEKILKIGCVIPSWKMLYCLHYCDFMGSKNENGHKDDYIRMGYLRNLLESLQIYKESKNLLNRNFFTLKEVFSKKDKPYVQIYMMIGLPGSGKDTFIKEHFDGDDYVVLSRDDIRVELGYCREGEKIVGNSIQEETVSKVFNERLIDAANDGKKIIINNINLKRAYRDDIINKLNNYNTFVTYIYVEAKGLNKNIERRLGEIDETVFYQMIEKFDWPDITEYDKFDIILT